ncbi:MAG: hypothetical protein H7X91_05715 [Burkholderiales bacterium]|nr:hypothetical protein [Burkholderiales bacterium]
MSDKAESAITPGSTAASGLWVIKLGGSLARSRHLTRWLQAIAQEGAGRAIIVPGGGRFADEVRNAQRLWRFDDAVAHRMALMAMQQFGLMLCGLNAGLASAQSVVEMHAALRYGKAVVWLPLQMTDAAGDIPMNWDVTSDSLAAWLASRVNARSLALVKFCRPNQFAPEIGEGAAVQALSEAGIVDPAFPAFMPAGVVLHLFAADQHAQLGGCMNAAESLP